ncbi:MAG: hypothetical protein QJR13_03760, partial [Bacillota bacterium]|nr:hypothetical protein [Bacillota bacterium]
GGVVKYMAIGEGGVNQEIIKTDSNNAITEYKTTSIASQATGFGLDLGVQAKLTDLLVVGLKVQDLVSQASGTTKTSTETIDAYGNRTTTESTQDWRPDLSPKLRAGVAFRPPTGTTLAADLEQDGTLHLGAEQNLLWNALSLRAGAILAPNQLTEYRAGLGFNLWALHLDVAAGAVGKGASAMLGLSAKF